MRATRRSVVPTYYPHDAGHEVAAAALLLALEDVGIRVPSKQQPLPSSTLQSPTASMLPPSTGPHAHTHAHSHSQLPQSLDPRQKLFFSHVHKAAGSTVTNFLRRGSGFTWCGHIVEENAVRPRSIQALMQWWHSPAPNCTLVSLEQPHLGEVLRTAADMSKSQSSDAHRPQVP